MTRRFRRSILAPPLRLLALLALALGFAACSRDASEVVVARLIDTDRDAAPLLDPHADFVLQPSWAAPLDGPAGLGAWSYHAPDAPAAAAGGGIDVGPLRQSRYLAWSGRLESGAVDLLRFRFRTPVAGQVELYWNGAGEDFAPQRYLLQTPVAGDPRRVDFEVGAARGWSGTVTRFGLAFLTPQAARQALVGAEGLQSAAGPSLGRGETRYVELDGRGLTAWLARPGFALRRRVTVPRGA